MLFSFTSLLDLVTISIGEITVYDDNGTPLMSENVAVKKDNLGGVQVGVVEVPASTVYLPADKQSN
jgi:hypothetical protein